MKRYLKLFLVLCGIGLTSCGSSGGGGGGATATPAKLNIDADLAKWSGTACATTSTYTITADDVSVTINAFPFTSTDNTMSEKILINTVDIIYTPVSNMFPALPTQYMALGGTQVDMGGSVTIPVRVAPQDLKGLPVLNALVCTSTIYSYYVTMTFHCRYLKSGDTFTVSAQTNIRFADFVE